MFKKLRQDESGVILVTVLVVTVVMMILSIGIVARSISTSMSEESQVSRVQNDELNRGIYWNVYMNRYVGDPVGGGMTHTLGNRTYTSTITTTAGTGPSATDTYNMTSTY